VVVFAPRPASLNGNMKAICYQIIIYGVVLAIITTWAIIASRVLEGIIK
jgi:hypothetical protein